jgi:uncharacterized DUF497 family protein
MNILPEPISFVWDKGNIDKNFKKHNITNQEAEEVFIGGQIFLFEDEKHSSSTEKRNMIWGITKKERKLTIVYTVRNNNIRVISARDLNRKERREYEQKIKTDSNI